MGWLLLMVCGFRINVRVFAVAGIGVPGSGPCTRLHNRQVSANTSQRHHWPRDRWAYGRTVADCNLGLPLAAQVEPYCFTDPNGRSRQFTARTGCGTGVKRGCSVSDCGGDATIMHNLITYI